MPENVNIADERMALYQLQKTRVDLDHVIEQKLRKTFPSLSQDIRLLNELLDKVEDDQKQNQIVNQPDHTSV